MYWDNFSIMNFFTMVMIASCFGFLVMNYDKIDIQFNEDYLQEYNQCQEDLERTQPICPAVICQDNSSWKMIWAFIIGLITMFFFYDYVIFPRLMKNKLEKFIKSKENNNEKD